MKVIFFSAKSYDEEYFKSSNEHYNHNLRFVEAKLSTDTVNLVDDELAVCVFVNDTLDREVLTKLSHTGIRLIALRCNGYNNIDIKAAYEFGFTVVRVPTVNPNYSSTKGPIPSSLTS